MSKRIQPNAVPLAPAPRDVCVEPLESRRYMSAVVKGATTKIMSLGDSITAGLEFDGSYRKPLQQRLAASGYKFDFVGSQTKYGGGMSDPQHEGYSGYEMIAGDGKATPTPTTGRQIYGEVISKAIRAYKPDVILLMIGVNDMRGEDAVDIKGRADEYRKVLGQIFSLSPRVKVIGAPVTYKRGTVDDARLEALADAEQTVAEGYKSRGYDMQWAPQAGGGPGGSIVPSSFDLPDGIHPKSADSYGRMANGFFNAIVEGTSGNVNHAPQVYGSTNAIVSLANGGANRANLKVVVNDDGRNRGGLKMQWTKVSGPGGVSFASPRSDQTAASFSKPGQYQLRLTVSDGLMKSTKDVLVVAARPNRPATPLAPSGVRLTRPAAGQVRIDWKDNSDNETDFVVERSTDPSFKVKAAKMIVSAGKTSYADFPTGAAAGASYYYRVRAINAAGASPNSASVRIRA